MNTVGGSGGKPRVAAKTDGEWRAVVDPAHPGDPALLFATLIHPDRRRPWAEVFVVAADLSRLRLYAVAGTLEPEAMTAEGQAYVRHGLVPPEHQGRLLAAFNGGFMTKHGHHGMHVDGVTLVPPRPQLCTILGLGDAVRIGSWKSLGDDARRAAGDGQLLFWRQAAPCMFEGGLINPLLRDEDVRNWGATIDGKVIIRRSAVGLNSSRDVLFVAVSVSEVPLVPGRRRWCASRRRCVRRFVFRDDEYVQHPAARDFFYLVRRDPPRPALAP